MEPNTDLCACKSLEHHESDAYVTSGSYTWMASFPIFGGNCAKGWYMPTDKELHEVFPHLQEGSNRIKGNPVQAAADFYLLDAIQSGLLGRDVIPTDFTDEHLWRRQRNHPFNETGMKLCGCPLGVGDIVAPCPHDGRISEFSWHLFRGTHEMPNHIMKLSAKAERLQNKLVFKWTPIFWSYGALAFASELAYLRSADSFAKKGETLSRETILGAFAAMEKSFGPESWAEHVPDLFDPKNASWSGAYGGSSWAECALQYKRLVQDKITPKLFVDRVFTLQHNTSTFLNKVIWYSKLPTKDEYGCWDNSGLEAPLYQIKYVLNAHAEDDYRTLLEHASDKVKKLWNRYWDHVQYERVVMRDLPAATPEWVW